MLKKPITYTDYNGKNVTENFYFNLSTAELVRLEMSSMMISEDMETTTGGLEQHMREVMASRSGKRIVEMFDMFVDASYGEKSEDGRKFVKNAEVLDNFKSTPAYDVFFMELITDAEAGSIFINGILPAELLKDAERLKGQQIENVAPVSREAAGYEEMPTELTDTEMLDALGALTVTDEMDKTAEVKDYSGLSSAEIRALPRHELLLAYKQRAQK